MPCDFGGKTFYVDVMAKDADGMVGIECVSKFHLGRLRKRIAQLRGCLPANSYLVLIFPSNAEECAKKAAELADESG